MSSHDVSVLGYFWYVHHLKRHFTSSLVYIYRFGFLWVGLDLNYRVFRLLLSNDLFRQLIDS